MTDRVVHSSVLASLAAMPAAPVVGRQMRRALFDLLFPPRCAVCRRVGSAFCPSCRERVQPLDAPVSGASLGVKSLNGIRSAGVYRPPLSLAIREFKYHRRTDLAASLGELLASTWRDSAVFVDFVAPVPLHDNRLRERGYNQAELLAVEFCRASGLPLVAPGLLARHRDTEHQVVLGLAERRQNVKDAFVWNGPTLAGLTVLLVDDVATTGSTLEACAEALVQAGAAGAWALTVARAADKPGQNDRRANASRRLTEG